MKRKRFLSLGPGALAFVSKPTPAKFPEVKPVEPMKYAVITKHDNAEPHVLEILVYTHLEAQRLFTNQINLFKSMGCRISTAQMAGVVCLPGGMLKIEYKPV